MPDRRPDLGRPFAWLWAAYAVSSYGTAFGFGAFPLIAVLVLHSGPAAVAALSAAGRVVGALCALPLGPWVEFRRKRPVMIAMDLVRFGALLTVPATYALGLLSFAQLLLVSMAVATADIAFKAASGAHLKSLVPPQHLLVANGRFEATTWTSTTVGPPLGGAAIGLFGPVVTVLADAVSYLLSALGIRAVKGAEPVPPRTTGDKLRARDLLDGWRHILRHPVLRPLLFNAIAVNGLIMASEPLIAVLLLGRLGFAPWEYGLVFASPCIGGLIGSRLARRFVARFGTRRVLVTSGALRASWSLGLAFVGPGLPGIVLIMAVQFALVTCCGTFNPVLATVRLENTPPDLVTRMLTAWSVSTSTSIAAVTAAWGVLGAVTSPRIALAAAGVLLLLTPLLLLRPGLARQPAPEGTPAPLSGTA